MSVAISQVCSKSGGEASQDIIQASTHTNYTTIIYLKFKLQLKFTNYISLSPIIVNFQTRLQ
jgi:hypothetical protein